MSINLENIKSRNKVNTLEKIKLKTKEILFKTETYFKTSMPETSMSISGYFVGVKVVEENNKVYLTYEKLWRNNFFKAVANGTIDKDSKHKYIIFRKKQTEPSYQTLTKEQAAKYLPTLFNLEETKIKAKEENRDLLEIMASLPYTLETNGYTQGSNWYSGEHYHVIPTPKEAYSHCQTIRKIVFLEKCKAEIVDEKSKLSILDNMENVRKNFKNKNESNPIKLKYLPN